MKRRKFLLTSGTALLGSTALNTASQRSVLGLNFDLVGTESVQPSSVNSILIDFQNFELVPKYVDENSDATVTITLDVEGFDPVKNQTTVSFQNGVTKNKSDLGSAIPIVLDGVNTSSSALDGSVTISVDHPSISDSYTQSFTITDNPLQNGLIGWWPLHEWSGRANDLSGNGNHGSVNGAIQGVAGRSGLTSYKFNGSENVRFPNEIYSGLTISYWYYHETNSKEQVTGDSDRGWHWIYHDPGNNELGLLGGDGNTQQLSVPLKTNEWTHIVIDWVDSDTSVYQNGEHVTTYTGSGSGSGLSIQDIGTGGDSYFTGRISDFRVYNRSLSDSEISDLYSLGSGDSTDLSLHDGSDSGAVSRYTFDSTPPTGDSWNTNELTDNTNSGTVTNGVRGSAKSFDGSDNVYMSASNNSTFNIDYVTLATWVKFDSVDDSYDGLVNSNVDNNGNSTYGLWRWRTGTSTNGIGFRINDDSGGSHKVETGITPAENEWYHYVGTFDGSVIRIYQNGVLMDEASANVTLKSQSTDFWIGNTEARSSIDAINGKLDDVRLYKRSLSPIEVQQLYHWGAKGKDLRERTTTLNKSDMLGWWKLNEQGGSTAYDYSGNGNDGTVSGAGPDDTGTVQSPTGGSAYKFDGSDDSIEASYIPEVSKNGIYSISVWVKPDSSVSDRHVFQNSAGTGNDRNGIEWENPELSFGYYDGSSYASIGGDANPDEWNHFVGVNNQGSLKAYINGKPVTKNPNLNIDVDNKVLIGEGGTADAGYWKDAMSDVRIYNRILTPQEVSYLYEQKF